MFTFARTYDQNDGLFGVAAGVASDNGYFTELAETNYTGGTQVLNVTDGFIDEIILEDFTRVLISGTEFKFNPDPNNLQRGEYFRDQETNQVRIRTLNNAPRARVRFAGIQNPELRSTKICMTIPAFVKSFNLVGKIPMSRNLEGFPTSRAELIAKKTDQNLLITSLKKGKEVNLFGIPMRIGNLRWKRIANDSEKIKLFIDFISKYAPYGNPSRNELDQEQRLKGDDCDKPLVGWVAMSQYTKGTSIQYSGDEIYIYVPRNTSRDTYITVRQLMTERAITNRDFLVYSESKIKAKKWGKTTNHIFSLKENPESYLDNWQMPGMGYLLPFERVYLTHEYRNREFIPQNIEELEEETKQKIQILYKYEGAVSVTDAQIPTQSVETGEDINIVKVPSSEVLRDPTLANDVSNVRKGVHVITLNRGVEVYRQTKFWGWVHDSSLTYSVIDKDAIVNGTDEYGDTVKLGNFKRIIFTPFAKGSFVASFWTMFRDVAKKRYYSTEDGYIYKEQETGKILTRLLQDDSNLAAIGARFEGEELLAQAAKTDDDATKAQLEEQGNAYIALSNAYQFNKTDTVNKTTTYKLEAHSKYFSDINKSADAECDHVEQKFAARIITSEQKRITEPNPGSTDLIPLPPIFTGKEFLERTEVDVTYEPDPSRYIVTRSVGNAEGAYFKKKFDVRTSEEFTGQPNIHQRLEINEALPPKKFVAGGFSTNLLSQSVLSEENKETKYLYNTPDSQPNGNIPTTPIRFPDVYDPSLGLELAKIKISMDNTKNANRVTLHTLYDDKYIEGDRITVESKTYVILGINFTAKIEDVGRLSCNDFRMNLGRYVEPTVNETKVKNNKQKGFAAAQNIASGLLAVDGQPASTNNALGVFTPEALAAAASVNSLDLLLEEAGLKLAALEEVANFDGISKFLKGGVGAGGAEGLLGGLSSFYKVPGEDGETIDLRERTNLEEFADFLSKSAWLAQLAELLKDTFSKLLPELNDSNGAAGAEEGGGGGAPGGKPPSEARNIFAGLAPNINLLGGDEAIFNMLQSLFNTLAELAELLADPLGEDGGGGGAGAGGGGGGAGGGGSGGAGNEPVIVIGEQTIYLPTTDFEGFTALLLEMIAFLLDAIANFDLSLEDLMNALFDKLGGLAGGLASGGGGGGGGAGAGGVSFVPEQPDVQINYIYPEGLPPATINIIAPTEDASLVNWQELLDQIDELMLALEELNKREFDFDLPDVSGLIGEGGSVLAPGNPQDGSSTTGADLVNGETPIGENGQPFGLSSDLPTSVIDIVVAIKDITGVIQGGVKPLPPFNQVGGGTSGISSPAGGSANSNTNGGFSASSSSTSGTTADGGSTSNPPGSSAPAASSGSTSGSNENTSSSGIEESGGSTGQPAVSGGTGEFGYGSWDSDGSGFNDDTTVPLPGFIFSLIPEDPGDPGFFEPVSNVERVLVDPENNFVVAPPNITHFPLYDGDYLLVEGAIASADVFWEFVDEVTGVNILTPYDVNPTIEFTNSYSGEFIQLKVSLRGAPEVSDIMLIDTIPSATLRLEPFTQKTQSLGFPDAQVDPNTLILQQDENAVDGAIIANSVLLRWDNPIHHATFPASSYTIQEKQPDFSWIDVATVSTEERAYLFEQNKVYRIVTNYEGQIQKVYSEEFNLEGEIGIVQTSFKLQAATFASNAIIPQTVEPDFFFTAQLIENLEDSLVHIGTMATRTSGAIIPNPVEETITFATEITENQESVLTHIGTMATRASTAIVPVPVEETTYFAT